MSALIPDLEPCSFCGGEAHFSGFSDEIECEGCEVEVAFFKNGSSAKAWNTRAEDPRLVALENELDEELRFIGGCGDGGCIIVKPVGMHTNGGCKCSRDWLKMQRFAYAHNRFADGIRSALSQPVKPEGGAA
ncbi:hypothetical protein U0C82_03920 [Fulvimarina sp. 2208YS6-2-32]|uniref:Uncharacterized protein n=1 Tax=Fulvimarina uroteuthidis TaxID=3098149 RepID=A0ABU5HZK7_9HYPH|nr:hypothetical protein [Fulvimarina sp. 2208YS6-2-32]MDY8108297.1 hypothetical protein [Fulvimarina sp. 2208YS6-2-32]